MTCAGFIRYSGYFMILMGLVCAGFSIYTLDKRGEDWTETGAYNSQHIFAIAVLIVGVLLFISGIFGSWGSAKDLACCLCTYRYFNVFLLIFFLILGTVSVFLLYAVGKDIQTKEDCMANDYVDELGEYDNLAQKLFCTDKCPCYVEQSKQASFKANIKADAVFSDKKEDASVQNCGVFKSESRLKLGSTKFMKLLETNFECAGFCEKSPYFLYSDINDDVEKTDTCAKVIGEEIETNFFVYMIITFAMALFMIFNIAATKCYKKPEEDTAAKYAANPTH